MEIDIYGNTILHQCARDLNFNKIDELLGKEVGMDPNIQNKNGWTFLHILANLKLSEDDYKNILHLFNKCKNIKLDTKEYIENMTPLHFACKYGNGYMIIILIEEILNRKLFNILNDQDISGRTPLNILISYYYDDNILNNKKIKYGYPTINYDLLDLFLEKDEIRKNLKLIIKDYNGKSIIDIINNYNEKKLKDIFMKNYLI
jgi:ankyrin repeat protein